MKTKIEKKINQQRSVMGVLDAHPVLWRDIPGFKKSYDRFVKNFKGIEDCAAELKMDSKPLDEKLIKSRLELKNALFPVLSVLNIYSIDANDKKLKDFTNLKETDLETISNKGLLKVSDNILKRAGKLTEKANIAEEKVLKKEKNPKDKEKLNISDYGVSGERLNKLNETLEVFKANLEELNNFKSARSASGKKLTDLLKENSRIRKQKLDKFVSLYQSSDVKFYDDYQKATITKADSKPKKNQSNKEAPVSD